jgi:EAL domain-containing protein (putative c-di-GMP-specific phosphodiesterase class I)
VMEQRESTYEMLDAITARGVQFSIDDFGTGYSSLSRLKHLPVNELKIDRSFISHMDSDPDDAIIAHSTIDLAHNLGLRVVAEGVESANVLEQLQTLGCDQVQGYYISRPLSVDNFTALLRHRGTGKRGT